MDDVGFDGHVVIEKFTRPGIVGDNPADRGGGQKHRIGLVVGHPCFDIGLAALVQFTAADSQELAVLPGKPAHEGLADHAGVAGDPHRFSVEGIESVSGVSHDASLARNFYKTVPRPKSLS